MENRQLKFRIKLIFFVSNNILIAHKTAKLKFVFPLIIFDVSGKASDKKSCGSVDFRGVALCSS
ncbi:MAG TPA: hypothetical protein DHV48_16250 [Prolixibacteraceae bacterium]|nr:hypothetical protein [Prolixibacteraceae bacterium]